MGKYKLTDFSLSSNPVMECVVPLAEEAKEEILGTQWSYVKDDWIVPVTKTFDRLEAGYYSLKMSNTVGLYFVKRNVELNKLYYLPNEAGELLRNDIRKFWTLEESYKKYNRVYCRNFLIYSAPGTGKTSLINLMCKELIDELDGIVINLNSDADIEMYPEAIKRIRNIEPDRKVITIIEDIDNFIPNESMYQSKSTDSLLLNILDGNLKTGNVVTIATTNYIDRISSRYTNRPSRFDRVIEFPLPNAESRKIFIESSVLPEDLNKIDIDAWVKRTEGFTIDHINELILLFFVFGHDEEESFETIERMMKDNSFLKNKTSVNKTNIGFNG
jgi:SpoVK/Ycf46/Vps4 family AAA+-type ATPase